MTGIVKLYVTICCTVFLHCQGEQPHNPDDICKEMGHEDKIHCSNLVNDIKEDCSSFSVTLNCFSTMLTAVI